MTFSPLAWDSDGEGGNNKIEEREKRRLDGVARVTREAVISWKWGTSEQNVNILAPLPGPKPCLASFAFSSFHQMTTKPGLTDLPDC